MEARYSEQSPLTDPRILIEDNRSKAAQRHIAGYRAAKDGENLTEVEGCSDARANAGVLIPRDDIIFRPSIAAAGDRSVFKYIITHPATKQLIVLQHYDGSTVTDKDHPTGCGGLGAKKQRLATKENPTGSRLLAFIDRIHNPDVYSQAYREALAVAQITDKPILAAALDHLTGLIHPLVVFKNNGRTIDASVPFYKFNDPAYIYRKGIPDLPDDQIPASLVDILKTNREQVAVLNREYPDFAQSQKIQNPAAIILTTSLLPTNIRYPGTFGRLNTNFGIEMPIIKDDGVMRGIDRRAFDQDVLAQLEYPINNASTAQSGHGGHGFDSMHRLIIETPNIELSRAIGTEIASLPWMQKWLALPHNQIWVGEVITGQTNAMETLTPST